MDTLERFNAALAYIETHLDGVIDGKEISKITFYSPYQFQNFYCHVWHSAVRIYP